MGVLAKGFELTGGAEESAGPSDWGRAIWTRRRLIVLLFFGFLVTSIGAGNLLPTTYKAEAILEVIPERQPNAPADPMTSAAADEIRLNTEAEKVGAEPVVRAVFAAWQAGQFGQAQDHRGRMRKAFANVGNWINERVGGLCVSGLAIGVIGQRLCDQGRSRGSDARAFFAFQSRLKVTPERDSRLIKVVFTAPDPQVAARVANAIVSEYLSRHADQTEIQSGRYVNWLQGRMDALRSQATKSDDAVAQYRGQTGLVEMAAAAPWSPTVEELEHAMLDVSSAEAVMFSARVKLDALRGAQRDPKKAKATPEIVGSKLIQDLTLQQATAQARLAGLLATHNANSPLMGAARAEIAATQAQINQEIDKLLDSANREYLSSVNLVGRLVHRVVDLKARIANEEIERVALRGLERRANADSDLYSAYLRQAREAIEAVSWQPVAASVVSSAIPPVEPLFPHNWIALPLAIIGSTFAAITIGARTELQRLRRVFSNPMDFRGMAGIRFAGAVPRVRGPAWAHLSDSFRASIESVAFRLSSPTEGTPLSYPLAVASALPDARQSKEISKPFTIAVTSAIANEGKSVLAASLAKQFHTDGARVLVIDADIRRPSILGILSGARDCPVTLITCALDGSHHNGYKNHGLHVLRLADMGGSASVTLAALPLLISKLKEHYEILIVDTPPLMIVSDALAAVATCDQNLFAVKWCSTSRQAVEFALHEFNDTVRARTRIVLTEVDSRTYTSYT
jgi:succinoglycan biosynthesis transport protein ExoP